MNICICDDNMMIHKEISKLLQSFFCEIDSPDIFNCFSGEQLVDSYSAGKKYDVVFLDIELDKKHEKMNGVDVAKHIREKDQDAIIIFISSYQNYVFDTFKYEAFHYIVKPITKLEFDDVFNRALHKYNCINNYFPVSWNHTRSNIRISDIFYIEAIKRRLIIHTKYQDYYHTGKISNAYEQLKNSGFVLVHQGYIVNMNFIESFGSTDVTLYSGEKIMVSVRKRGEAIMIYDKFIQKWKW